MDKNELKNWQRIKDYFEALPEDQRENWFYRRAKAILEGKLDPLK